MRAQGCCLRLKISTPSHWQRREAERVRAEFKAVVPRPARRADGEQQSRQALWSEFAAGTLEGEGGEGKTSNRTGRRCAGE